MRKRLWDLAKSRIEIGTILPGHRHKVTVCTAAGAPGTQPALYSCSGGARLRSRGFHTRESGFYIYENIGRP